jgi:hypothetical protein
VWEELITQSRYPIKDARPPGIYHSISQMHFVQPGQKCQTIYGSMKVCNYKLDHCNGHRTCETLTSNDTVDIPVISTCLSVVYPDSKTDCMQSRPLHIESVEGYTCRNVYMPYAGESGMLIHVYRKLTMAKLKSSRLSYNWVVSFPPASMFNKM